MTAQLPDPLVPAEVDLRGLDYMPFFGNHLFGSEFNAVCCDAEWRAGVTLWWAAWNQQPAGSLPDDDTALCRLADLGRDIKAWRKVKDNAMRGFVKCSDGRLYHRFLCKQVMVAWEKRVQERERKRKWREKKQGHDGDGYGDSTGTYGGTGRGRNADVPAEWNGRDVTGRDVNKEALQTPVDNSGTARGRMAAVLRALGIQVTPSNPLLVTWVEQGVTETQAREAVTIARDRKPEPVKIPAAYLDPIIAQVTGKNGAAHPSAVKAKPWFLSASGIEAKGVELGIERAKDEAFPTYRDRVYQAASITPDMVRQAEADFR